MNVDDIFGEFQDSVNMGAGELRDWRDSEQFEAYTEYKSGGQEPTEPINDAIRLLETPKAEWSCEDDGFNECEQAEELVNFNSRMSANESGDPIPGTDPPLSKRDASLISWGQDPNPDRKDFDGDLYD
jgi:hypothetical protein